MCPHKRVTPLTRKACPRSASCTISVEPLETGHTRDVTGLMVIQRQREGAERGDATPLKRRLFFLVGQAAVKFMERPSL